jgi:MarR family transcriptional regulator, 2-MHQ and catechol-resistance regulon repressor
MLKHQVIPTPASTVESADLADPVAPALKLWVVLNRARRAVAALDERHIASMGVTPGEFSVMEALYHKGPLLLGEVRRKVLASSGGITYLVDKLAAKGLVERQACPSDRRAIYAALTDAGRTWMDDAFPDHARCLARALSGLDGAETRQAIELLRKLGLHAEELGPCGGD